MEADVLKYGWLIVLTLAQIVLFWVKGGGKKNNKKDNPGDYGERIATLEEAVDNLKDDVKEIKDKLK